MPFPMKKVYVARLAASHGAFAPASAVWRSLPRGINQTE